MMSEDLFWKAVNAVLITYILTHAGWVGFYQPVKLLDCQAGGATKTELSR